VGDDCALLRPNAGLDLAVTTDMLVEGQHFSAEGAPRALGHKALAVNLSDLAAMGAAPRWALLALGLPSAEERWLGDFSAGLFALAERYGVELIGGDTTRSPVRTISIVAIGEVPAGVALYRSGARAGDDVWVSGELGGAALALQRPARAAQFPELARRLHEPEPRVERLQVRKIAPRRVRIEVLAEHVGAHQRIELGDELGRLPRAVARQAAVVEAA